MKYELTKHTKTMPNGDIVYRIKALKTFVTSNNLRVIKGRLGGWVSSMDNLSQEDRCWLFDNAVNSGDSRRIGDSLGNDDAWSYGCSIQSGDSRQSGHSQQFGHSHQAGHSFQSGNSRQYGHSQQYGDSIQTGKSRQCGYSAQCGTSCQSGTSIQSGGAQSGDSRHIVGEDTGHLVLCLGPCGEFYRHISVQPDMSIVAGCFHGSFDEFKTAIIRKYGSDYGSYRIIIPLLECYYAQRLESQG